MRATQKPLADVVAHEHVGWWDLLHTDEFRDVLRSVPQINVNPNTFHDPGGRLGLRQVDCCMPNETFYAMSSFLDEHGEMVLLISHDEAYLGGEIVQSHLDKWLVFFERIVALCVAGEDMTVGELFGMSE